MKFEDKRFCQIRTLAERWDCSHDRIYDCLQKGLLRAWHPEQKVGHKGLMVEVQSVLSLEVSGIVDFSERDR